MLFTFSKSPGNVCRGGEGTFMPKQNFVCQLFPLSLDKVLSEMYICFGRYRLVPL